MRARIFNSTARSSLAATGAQADLSPAAESLGVRARVPSSLSSTGGLLALGAQAPVQSSSSSVGLAATGAQASSSAFINPNLAAFGAQVTVGCVTQFPPPQASQSVSAAI